MQQNIAHNLEEKPRTKDILIKESFNFTSLLLSNTTLQGLKEAGFYKPSPIQLKAIPLGRCGLDLIVQAKSGTGKTAVFTIIALEMVKTTNNALQVLVFAPTREIAIQIEDVIKTIGQAIPGLKVGSFIGGLPFEEDIKKLKNCHVAVGAPGRLKHLVEKSHMKTDSVRLVVLDEADKLMEQCFQSDINYVFRILPERKQVIALSATYQDELDKFLANYMQSPTFVTPEVENPILLGLRQFVTIVRSHINVTRQMTIKNEELIRLLSKISFTQCLVFFNSQSRAEGISNTLNKDGWKTTYISAAQSQAKRIKAVNSLKKFECKILLSTDLTARGIDAANVDLVINYDVPFETATYLHRMGRAGRYGSHGLCVSIAADGNELKKLQDILGEIGGTELGISKLPPGEEGLRNVWECDLNSCEKIYGTISGDNKNVDLKNSVFDLKKSKTKNRSDSDIMSSNLERLSVDENINRDDCHNTSQMEIQNIKIMLNHKQKIKEEISQKCSEMDAESLLKSLASGNSILPTKSSEEEKEYSKIVTESLLKSLASGKSVLQTNIKKKNEEISSTVTTNSTSPSLLKDASVIETDDQNQTETNPDIINPASLYPWVPVENPVLMGTYQGENLLEDSEEENSQTDQILKSGDNRKRKRKQYKKSNSRQQKLVKEFQENSVLLRNVAFYSITQLLTNKDDSLFNSKEDFDLIVNRIKDYLSFIKENQQQLLSDMSKYFESHTCNDLLENITEHSRQWSRHQALKISEPPEEEDPEENIFKLGYFYMNKNTEHWIDALGDKYEPEEEKESEIEEDMEYIEEEELDYDDDGFENATNFQPYKNKSFKQSDAANADGNYYNYNHLEWMPLNNDQSNFVTGNSSLEYPYNPMYASYFDYHRESLEKDALTFENVPSFNNYLAQWQFQVQSVRDYVQQNIYLQEMNNYQYQRGQHYDYYPNNSSSQH